MVPTTDKLRSIEGVLGSGWNDTIIGDAQDNTLIGLGGDDILDGGAGSDIAVYTFSGGSVNVNLVTGLATGFAGTDTLISIERVRGSEYNDTITGNSDNNYLDGGVGDDSLSGGVGNDTLLGGVGNDTLDGGSGIDSMTGGDGDDTYYVQSTLDVVVETEAIKAVGGNDLVHAAVNYILGANVENLRLVSSSAINGTGNALDNTIYAANGVNEIDGGTGNDTLSYLYTGGTGQTGVTLDLSLVNSSGWSSASGLSGADLVRNIEHLTGSNLNDVFTGTTGNNVLDGGAGDDTLVGGAGNDTLLGGSGNDSLDGGGGIDFMTGGDGNDVYAVQHASDIVVETNAVAGVGGTDMVIAALTYTLGGNVENLKLLGAVNGTGNSLDNTLFAGAGNNSMDGASGNDTASYAYAGSSVTVSLNTSAAQATGGSGSDTLLSFENLTGSLYDDILTGNAGNNVLNGGSGMDTVSYAHANSGVTLSLALTVAQVTGGAGIDTVLNFEHVIGSSFNDSLTGNWAGNVMQAGAGNDTLSGGSGADSLYGGSGNDLYYVDGLDSVVEAVGEGTDQVVSSVSYALTANVENLRLNGTGAISGAGNALGNILTGNDNGNSLNGDLGNDTLAGGLGNDMLTGGAGNDIFLFNSTLNGNGNGNRDVITDFSVADDTIHLENAIFAKLGAAGVLNISYFAVGTAADGNDYLIYDSSTGSLTYDVDGNGAGIAVQFATIGTGLALTSADFLVI